MIHKTIDTINMFYSLHNKREYSDEERNFLHTLELNFAKSIIIDFGDDFAKKLGTILLAATESD